MITHSIVIVYTSIIKYIPFSTKEKPFVLFALTHLAPQEIHPPGPLLLLKEGGGKGKKECPLPSRLPKNLFGEQVINSQGRGQGDRFQCIESDNYKKKLRYGKISFILFDKEEIKE
jgi:hypothetical protein